MIKSEVFRRMWAALSAGWHEAGLPGRLVVVAAVMLVVAVSVAPTVVGGDVEEQQSPGRPRSTGDAEAPVTDLPPMEPIPTPDVELAPNPLWTVSLPGDISEAEIRDVGVTDTGYVIDTFYGLVAVDRLGQELWRHNPFPTSDDVPDYFSTQVTSRVVVTSVRLPDDSMRITVLDAATGAVRWTNGDWAEKAAFYSMTADTVYLSECRGQSAQKGDCVVRAHELETGQLRWKILTHAGAEVVNVAYSDIAGDVVPPVQHVLVGSHPTSPGDYLLASYKPDTAETISEGYAGKDDLHGSSMIVGDTLVSINKSFRASDGCDATLTGYAVDDGANLLWRLTARVRPTADGLLCERWPMWPQGGRIGITTVSAKTGDSVPVPSVVDVATGNVEWSAPAGGIPIAASSSVLLVVEPSEVSPAPSTTTSTNRLVADHDEYELVAYGEGDPRPLWRRPFPASPGYLATIAITDSEAVFVEHGGMALGYDLASGAFWSLGGVAQVDSAWFATCIDGTCQGYAIQ